MDWTQMVVVIAAMGAMCFMLDKYVPARAKRDPDEVINLKGKISALEQQIEFWTERGDRYGGLRDAYEETVKKFGQQIIALTPTPEQMQSYRQAVLDLKKETK
jgi:hypothetical protein